MIPYPLFNVNPRAEQDSVAFDRKMAEAVATAKQLGHAPRPANVFSDARGCVCDNCGDTLSVRWDHSRLEVRGAAVALRCKPK